MVDITASPWKELLVALVTTVVTSIFFLAKRRIEGSAATEQLERQSALLDVRKKLRESGLTVKDLRSFEDELTKRHKKNDTEDEVAAELALGRSSSVDGSVIGETQAEMNILAGADLDIIRAMMAKAMHELVISASCNGDSFETSQKAWERYAKAEARARSVFCEGSSMYPSHCTAALKELTVSRIADIREQIKYLRSMG